MLQFSSFALLTSLIGNAVNHNYLDYQKNDFLKIAIVL